MLPIGSTSLAQTTIPGDTGRWRALVRAPRLDALVRRADSDGVRLEHYHHCQGRPDHGWDRGATLTLTSTAPAALTQLPDTLLRRRGELVALVPEAAGIAEWRHDPAGEPFDWRRTAVLGAGDSVCVVALGAHLHAVIVAQGRARHWYRPTCGGWVAGQDLGNVDGAPALTATHGRLTAALPHQGTITLVTGDPHAWRESGRVADPCTVPALAPRPGGGVLLCTPQTSAGVLWWRASDGVIPDTPARPDLAPTMRVHSVALSASALSGGLDASGVGLGAINLGGARQAIGRKAGWLQALVVENDSLFLWRREQRSSASARTEVPRWVRSSGLRVQTAEPTHRAAHPSQKSAQLSGERDTQPSPGDPRTTLSRSEAVSGVRGTDLGVRADIGTDTIMLFGDTHWRRKRWATRDSLARITRPEADLPQVEFHGAPLRFRGLGATMTEYDVPLDAFAHGRDWYAFTSSNHFARHQVMGRSLIARALDIPASISGASRRPFRFQTIAQISDLFFINISCAPLRRDLPGSPFPDGQGPLLGLWGAGAYRADDLRFAVLDPAHDLTRPRLAFFAGLDAGVPIWSAAEPDAAPLLHGAYGEVSVRWLPPLASYGLLTMTGPEDAAGGAVVLRTAALPWGPWSDRLLLFDWVADGLSFGDPSRRFIHAVADDLVGDDIFNAQAGRPGGAYAPYLFDASGCVEGVRLRYTLSTWNPYQVVLMEHLLTPADLAALCCVRG